MKAKLLQGVEISSNEMLATGTEVEIIGGSCGCDGYEYICELPNYRQIKIELSKLEITDWHPHIDWEQRRYEIARSAMNGILSDEEEVGYACSEAKYEDDEKHTVPTAVARFSIACADALISELRKGGKQ